MNYVKPEHQQHRTAQPCPFQGHFPFVHFVKSDFMSHAFQSLPPGSYFSTFHVPPHLSQHRGRALRALVPVM